MLTVSNGNTSRFRRRRPILVLCCLAASMVLTACASGSSGDGSSGGGDNGATIRLGALLPLTGSGAEIGQAWKRGIELAVDKVNSDGGVNVAGKKKKFDVKMIDSESTPAGAVRGLQQEIADGTNLLLGPGLSTSFATAYQTLKGSKDQLLLTPSAASEPFLSGDNLLFKTQSSQSPAAIAQFAKALADKYHPKRVAILETQDPTGDIIGSGMADGFKAAGVDVAYNNKVAVTTTDLVPFVSAIKGANPDLVVAPYLDKVASAFVDQAVRVGYSQPIFANYAGSQATVAGHEKDINTFVWQLTTRAVSNPDDPAMTQYRAAYQGKYGEPPKSIDFYDLSFYDPVLALAQAIEKAGSNTDLQAIGKALKQVDSWPGQVLKEHFDEKGLVHYPAQVATLNNGTVTYADLGSS